MDTSFSATTNLTFSGLSTSQVGTVPTVAGVNLGTATAITFVNGLSSGTYNLVAYKAEGPVTLAATDGGLTTAGTGGTGASLTVGSSGSQSAFLLTAANSTPTAGVADALTIKAVDIYGNTVTTYTGSHNITFGGLSTALDGTIPTIAGVNQGSATALTFASGVNTTTANLLAYRAEGPVSLTATDGSHTTAGTAGSTASLTISPAVASAYRIAGVTGTPTAGVADTLTITQVDQYRNVTALNTTKTLTFSGLGTSTNGNIPTIGGINEGTGTSVTFANGQNTTPLDLIAYKAEGPVSLAVTDGSVNTAGAEGAPLSLTVSSTGVQTAYRVTTTDATPTTGAANTLNIAAVDAYGNVITTVTGTHSLTFSGPGTSVAGNVPTVSDNTGVARTIGTATAITFTSGVSSGTGRSLIVYKAEGPVTLAVTDGTYATTGAGGAGVSLTASSSGTQSAFRVTAASLTPVVGAGDQLSITAVDAYGNTITSYSGNNSVTFGGLGAGLDGSLAVVTNRLAAAITLGSSTSLTFTSGTNSAGGVMVAHKAEGPVTLTITDGTHTGASTGGTAPALTPSPAAASAYRITAATGTPAAGANDALTITAVDQFRNVTTFTGSPTLTFSGLGTP